MEESVSASSWSRIDTLSRVQTVPAWLLILAVCSVSLFSSSLILVKPEASTQSLVGCPHPFRCLNTIRTCLQAKKLAAAEEANAALEAEVEQITSEKGALQTEVLLKDFDLTHSNAMKALLDDRVTDLERVIAAHDDLVSANFPCQNVGSVLAMRFPLPSAEVCTVQ